MSGTVEKKNAWSDVLFVAGGLSVIAAVLWLLARCGVTC